MTVRTLAEVPPSNAGTGMSDAEGAAAICSVGHPQVYRTLVQDAGWSVPAYREWLAKALAAALA